MLTQERADILTDFLTSDADRAKKLFEMEPEAALAEINAADHDFSLDELMEYCTAFKLGVAQSEDGELSEEALMGVSGGLVITTALCVKVGLGMLACFGVGAGIGIAAGAKW